MSEETVAPRNEPVHTDGRATEQSVEKRIEEKLFGKEPPKEAPKTETPKEEAAPTEEAPEAQNAVDDDSEEYEFEGDRYVIPKKFKPALDGYKDYTAKTMSAADRQRHADLIIEQSRQAQAMQAAVQPKHDAVAELQREIKRYENVDWNTWIQTNPVEAQKGMLQLQMLNHQREKAESEFNQTVRQQMELINQTRAKLKEENEKVLARSIKDWNADKAKSLTEFAGKTYGFSDQELSSVFDSRVWQMIHDANKWRSLEASKPQVNKAIQASKTLKPAATEQKNAAQVRQANIKKEIKSGKSDHDKAKGIQKWLESRL